uniref:Uncharacterized protein n=1 Tax=Globodera rostochiensis TaxID=31243 RepID=A0A914IA30_GLORO
MFAGKIPSKSELDHYYLAQALLAVMASYVCQVGRKMTEGNYGQGGARSCAEGSCSGQAGEAAKAAISAWPS